MPSLFNFSLIKSKDLPLFKNCWVFSIIDLSVEEKITLLRKEIQKIRYEIEISELIYDYHGEDTYEDLFRDNIPLLNEKINGILLAIKNLEEYNDSCNSDN